MKFRKTEFNIKWNEQALIEDCLKHYKGNLYKVADDLGITRVTLYNKMREYKIDWDKFRESRAING